ncbi:unnamed protein product [Lepeophtheirus salmonis]|uniref:(salmon louse) hypothetical protein n=1 Tax=Lepeophtheirus salmonis TaxID=72036 RepID=A0A7R8D6P6_LEPSM|nr:unnamed protein product [Lepeophtheirus salmonis]CAF3046159.1 unnamed protein product [Lepeophtheirus salmonis]
MSIEWRIVTMKNIDDNRIVEDNLKGAEKSTVLDTGVDSNCGQVDKNEEMTPSSPSGLPLDVASRDNTLDLETKTGECQEEISSAMKTKSNNTLTEEDIRMKGRIQGIFFMYSGRKKIFAMNGLKPSHDLIESQVRFSDIYFNPSNYGVTSQDTNLRTSNFPERIPSISKLERNRKYSQSTLVNKALKGL